MEVSVAEAHVHDLPLSTQLTGVFNALSDVVTGDIVVMANADIVSI